MSAPEENRKRPVTRIDARMKSLRDEGRGGLFIFFTAGDPDSVTSLAILKSLPGAGADIIELGMPFSDPMADGPAIQDSSRRALAAGMTLKKTLALVADFRRDDNETPIVLMGYYNPIYIYGVDKFLADAAAAGVDGLIIVDLPPEENAELCAPAIEAGISFIFLIAPTTDDGRLSEVVQNASGFVYYVSITGITGTASAAAVGDVAHAVARIKRHTDLPVAVGFGIRTPQQAGAIASVADAVAVGTAVVERIRDNLDADGTASPALVANVSAFVADLAASVRTPGKKDNKGSPA